jgi:hypothetical protein
MYADKSAGPNNTKMDVMRLDPSLAVAPCQARIVRNVHLLPSLNLLGGCVGKVYLARVGEQDRLAQARKALLSCAGRGEVRRCWNIITYVAPNLDHNEKSSCIYILNK